MHANIRRGLYIFSPFFTAVYNQERVTLKTICTKQGNSSIKNCGLKLRVGYNGACTVVGPLQSSLRGHIKKEVD